MINGLEKKINGTLVPKRNEKAPCG